MFEHLFGLMAFSSTKHVITTLLDFGLVWYAIYRFLLSMQGTRASRVMLGLAAILVLYVISGENILNLVMIRWILDKFVSAFVVLLVILFQDDIRYALSQVGSRGRLFSRGIARGQEHTFNEIVRAAVKLSRNRRGALMILKRQGDLEPHISEGVRVNVTVDAEILFLLFLPDARNPLHDGAAIIEGDRLVRVACYLPLTDNPDVDISLGSRHRAAIGLTERVDAVAVIVSEETGIISVAVNGVLDRNLDASALKKRLIAEFSSQKQEEEEVLD